MYDFAKEKVFFWTNIHILTNTHKFAWKNSWKGRDQNSKLFDNINMGFSPFSSVLEFCQLSIVKKSKVIWVFSSFPLFLIHLPTIAYLKEKKILHLKNYGLTNTN